jgi:ABC-type uncharacterized transport system substrate-binding protein
MRKAGVLSILVVVILLAVAVIAEAQQAGKVYRIGALRIGSVSSAPTIEAFRQGLRDLGYIEGKNIIIEYRYAEGKLDRLPELAAELVRLKIDVILAAGTQTTTAAKQATSTIPIVAAGAGDLVGTGLVASLARPGSNVTGSTRMSTDLSGKRLELLKEVMPKASRVAVVWHPFPGSQDEKEVQETEIAARALKIRMQNVPVRVADELQRAYATMEKERADALIILGGAFTSVHRRQLLDLAAKNRLPSMCEESQWANDGCVMSYGPDLPYLYRRAAYFVDKILKGAKPADLPVEQPTKFELVINLKTAKQIVLTIPPNVLARADRVIK